MSAIVNERDLLLQAAAMRDFDPSGDKAVIITADSPVFKVATSGAATPSVINLTAKPINIPGNVTWSVTGASAITTSANTATLSYSAMTASSAIVQAQIVYQGVTYLATFIVTKVLDGANGAPGANGSNGADGSRGTVNVAEDGHSSWSSTDAFWAIVNAGYGGPQDRDIVTLYNSSTGFSQTRYYQSGSWLLLSAYINGNLLVSGTVSCAALAADTMTGQTIQTAASGTRIVINEGKGNTIRAYVGSTIVAEFGGSSTGYIHANTASNIRAGLGASATGLFPAVSATTSSSSALSAAGFFDAAAGAGISAKSSTGNAIEIGGGVNGIVQKAGGTNFLYNLCPAADAAYSLGGSGFRWNGIYATSSTITTSDERTKFSVEESDLGLDFVLALRPVRYKNKIAENLVTHLPCKPSKKNPRAVPKTKLTARAGRRYHYGFIAQDVRELLVRYGALDAAFWTLDDPQNEASQQALRYEQLIAPVVRAIQELAQRIDALQPSTSPEPI